MCTKDVVQTLGTECWERSHSFASDRSAVDRTDGRMCSGGSLGLVPRIGRRRSAAVASFAAKFVHSLEHLRQSFAVACVSEVRFALYSTGRGNSIAAMTAADKHTASVLSCGRAVGAVCLKTAVVEVC